MIELHGKYTSAKIFANTIESGLISQVVNVLNHPIFKDCKIRIMPDCHIGKGCTIGFTSEMPKNGEIIPNIIGVDQSCTVSAIKVSGRSTQDYLKLDKVIKEYIPTGTGGKRKKIHKDIPLYIREMIEWACKDFLKTDPENDLLKIGTLGAGNHFISLEEGKTGLYLVIHSGSRNIGNELAKYFQRVAIEKNCYLSGIFKELSYIDGKDAENYLKCATMCNLYAKCSHEIMMKEIIDNMDFKVERDIPIITTHNYINLEDNIIRKGAISCYKHEKAIIPINMAYGSFIVEGKSNEDWNYSGPHGAGRLFSRSKAKEELTMDEYEKSMKGIHSCCICKGTIDEAPMAYKNEDEIKEQIEPTAEIVDHLIPKYNYKAC